MAPLSKDMFALICFCLSILFLSLTICKLEDTNEEIKKRLLLVEEQNMLLKWGQSLAGEKQ